mgnify:FL=1|tara:strand:+ start:544 stop:981 length:438 start_codon:yes stop_codon:yes gene_type:complete
MDAGFTQSSFSGFKDGKAPGQKNFLQLNTKLHNCWICEAWVECFFEIDLIELFKIRGEDLELSDNLDVQQNVYIHFDFDDYQPDKMDDQRINGDKGTYQVHRMVPQGRYHYYYTYLGKAFIDNTQTAVIINGRMQDKIGDKMNCI